MAKIPAIPDAATVQSFRGTLDFYVYKGQPCVRTWPRYRARKPTPAEALSQQRFTEANHAAANLPASLILAYRAMAQGTEFTWHDLFMRDYLYGILTT